MDIRQSLEANFLTCKYCNQAYRKPKVLVCLHSFCQACLEQILAQKDAEVEAKELEAAKRYYAAANSACSDYKGGYRKKWSSKFRYGGYDSSANSTYNAIPRYSFSTGKSSSISCPLCDKETALPSGGVAQLPTDQLADRLASMVDRMPTFPVCDVCTRKPLLDKAKDSRNGQNGTESGIYSNSDSSDEEKNGIDTRASRTAVSVTHTKPHRPKMVSGSSCKTDTTEISGPRPASAACLECSKRLCVACRETHTKMPVTSNHVLIRLDQMDDIRCIRHPRELRKLFCLTCRENICIVCTFDQSGQSSGNGHSEHEVMSIREAVTSYQSELSRESTATQSHINQIESLLNSLQICEQEMRKIYGTIDQGAKQLAEQINKQKRGLQNKLDEIAGVSLAVLSAECERMNAVTNEWYDFLNDDRITSRLDLMDPLEALAEAGPMLDRVRQCLDSASTPINTELAKQTFLTHLKTAEDQGIINGDSGIVSSHSSSSPSNIDDQRALYWRTCLGHFLPGHVELGRVATDKELAAEAIAEQSRVVSTFVQTGPELIKPLPPPKGTQRHRAIQINMNTDNVEEQGTQTDPITIGSATNNKVNKQDTGTQYVSADINPPVSMYRSLRQILVQK